MAVCVIFPDGVAMEGLLLWLPGVHLHATAVVILCLYHESLVWLQIKPCLSQKCVKRLVFLLPFI